MGFPTIDLMRTGANIVRLRKAAGLTVHDLQMGFGFNSVSAGSAQPIWVGKKHPI